MLNNVYIQLVMHGSVCWVLRPTSFLEQCLCCRCADLFFSASKVSPRYCGDVRSPRPPINFFTLWKDADPTFPSLRKRSTQSCNHFDASLLQNYVTSSTPRPKYGFCEISN